jgi:hypothetical protein
VSALIHRSLRGGDPSIELLDAGTRHAIARSWLGRAESELRVSLAFEVIARTLAELEAEAELTALATRAVSDERRHSEICRRLASAYLGREAPPVGEVSLEHPEHAKASPELRRTLFVVGMCCVNETTASVFLEAVRSQTRAPLVRAALGELMGDDIDHARIGWAHLASPRLTNEIRAAVAAWLPRLLAANLARWRTAPEVPDSAVFAEHGCPSKATVETAALAAIRDIMLPGFVHVGVDPAPARAWYEHELATSNARYSLNVG